MAAAHVAAFLFAPFLLLDHIHPTAELSERLTLPELDRTCLTQGKADRSQLLRRVSSSPKDCNKKFSVLVITAV